MGRIILLLTLFVVVSCLAAEEVIVEAWSYYNDPPFYIQQDSGFAHDFIELLNRECSGEYSFHLKLLPRKRIDQFLLEGRAGIVLFVSWIWMNDPDQSKYLWSPILLHGSNDVVSSMSMRIEYDGTDSSLYGLRLGGVLGHRYEELDKACSEGLIIRSDTKSQEQSLKKVILNRIDVTILPRSILDYYEAELELEGKIYRSQIPLGEFTRHILVTPDLQDVHEKVSEIVSELDSNEQWHQLLKKYHLTSK